MRKLIAVTAGLFFGVSLLSGCVVRSYNETRDRVDQDLSIGNRGYLQGTPEAPGERKTDRTTRVVEIELHPWVTFDKSSKQQGGSVAPAVRSSVTEDDDWGNRGYVSGSEPAQTRAISSEGYEPYIVQKGGTLQKISRKFYGTTKRWSKIYEANGDILKGPDKIYPGQTINIPKAGMLAETPENLK
ncbi:MAG: LysM peptidoglycan-binding domain-containing protein [Candidatus Omnitrophica bacterium]|nr:LysM peptidoglycan-binding domain-containing protein [Candidatus Omnitrophota bacterium]